MQAISPRKAPVTLRTLRIRHFAVALNAGLAAAHAATRSSMTTRGARLPRPAPLQNSPASFTLRSHSSGEAPQRLPRPPQRGQLRALALAAPRRPLGHGVSAARSFWQKALPTASTSEMRRVLDYLHERQKAFRSFGNY